FGVGQSGVALTLCHRTPKKRTVSAALWSAPTERSDDGALAMAMGVGKSRALGVGQTVSR
ncbi:MAG: hypothetical protein AB1813_03040, partial [Verrucomicrobiota bacterium]